MKSGDFNALVLGAGRGHLEGVKRLAPASTLIAVNFHAFRQAAQKGHAKLGLRHNDFDQRPAGRGMPKPIHQDPIP